MPQVRNALLSSCKLLLCLQPWACQLVDAADTAVAFCLHYKLVKLPGDVKLETLSESPPSGEVCACLTCVGKTLLYVPHAWLVGWIGARGHKQAWYTWSLMALCSHDGH